MNFAKSLDVAMNQFENIYLRVSEMDARRDTHDNMSKFERMKISVDLLRLIEDRDQKFYDAINKIGM